ncbi:MAG: hypothetical protein HY347_04325 [candidate division NC10 bacterium]|nr:hypothetical protein [candidate division NC10 bacterium]
MPELAKKALALAREMREAERQKKGLPPEPKPPSPPPPGLWVIEVTPDLSRPSGKPLPLPSRCGHASWERRSG